MPQQGRRTAGRRLEVLRLLRESNEPMGIIEMADRLGIHANTVRFHVETLVGNGQVEPTAAKRGVRGRPPRLFQATPGMDPMGPRHYRILAEVLTASLAKDPEPGGRAVEAGRVWGRQQASTFAGTAERRRGEAVSAVNRLVRLLDDLGFKPDQAAGNDRSPIGLRHCPFLELAANRTEVVCGIHLGLMQGAMESWGSPVTVDRLDAFVEPDLCIAHLGAKGAS